jgi:hypothetical protein
MTAVLRDLVMKMRFVVASVFAITLAGAAVAQDAGSAAPAGQNAATQNAAGQNSAGQNAGSEGAGGRDGQRGRGGRGGFGGMGMMSRGVMGTVSEAAADHITVKTFLGDTYTVQFSGSTRFVKMPAGQGRGAGRGEGEGADAGAAGQDSGQGSGQDSGRGQGRGWARGGGNGGGNPPQAIKSTDIKAGDVIEARGEVDATAKSVAAVSVALVDPERAQQMQAMVANFGKTWLMGKVTGIDGVKVTLTGSLDNAAHIFVADENTTFRRRRDPITLADIQVGDTVRVDGAVKDGVFTAGSVGDMGAMQAREPRGGPGSEAPPSGPPAASPQ